MSDLLNNPMLKAKIEVGVTALGLCAESEQGLFERLEGLFWKGFKAGLTTGVSDTSLYHSVNRMMAILGADGEIDTRSNEVHEVMSALKFIDGGNYQDQKQLAATITQQAEEIAKLRKAALDVIECHRAKACVRYSDANKAESWACVITLRAVLGSEVKND